jgi:hypothetical protein
MAGVGDDEAIFLRVESHHHGGGEDAVFGSGGEFAIEQADDVELVGVVNETADQQAKLNAGFGNTGAVTGDVGDDEADDFPAATGGEVMHIATGVVILTGVAVHPCVEAGHDDAAIDGAISAPDLHALHVFDDFCLHRAHPPLFEARVTRGV